MNNSHTIEIYKYNPENLKEVIGKKSYVISYVPTKKWNENLILVNGKYCGHILNIQFVIPSDWIGKHQNIREDLMLSFLYKLEKDNIN